MPDHLRRLRPPAAPANHRGPGFALGPLDRLPSDLGKVAAVRARAFKHSLIGLRIQATDVARRLLQWGEPTIVAFGARLDRVGLINGERHGGTTCHFRG
jgi:hypothetical protein